MRYIESQKIKYLAHISFFVFATLFTLRKILGVQWFRWFKLVPMIILIVMLLPLRNKSYILKTIIGLGFGSLGDALLQYGPDSFFAAGAGAFLVGHCLYTLAFLQLWQFRSGALLIQRKILTLVAVALFFSLASMNLVYCISDKLKNEQSVMVYLLSIYLVFLSFTAVNPVLLLLGDQKIAKQSILLVIGGIFFFISDNVLGRNQFTDYKIFGKKQLNGVVIMATYYLAQYFITLGMKEDYSTDPHELEGIRSSQIENYE